MKSSYETLETRRLTDARKAAKNATTIATDVKNKVEDPETGLDAALNQANQAIEIIQDPDGPVQQALGEATTARDEAEAAQTTANQALANAALAKTTADGKNNIYRGQNAPTAPASGFVQGDLWFKITATGQVTNINVWNGTAWVSNLIVADEILVPGSLGTTSIKDGAVTTPLIQAGAVVTNSLAAGAATMDKLTIGDTTNLVDDPTFAHQAWSTGAAVSYYEAQAGRALRWSYAPTGAAAMSSIFMGIKAGDAFLLRAQTYNRAPGVILYMRVIWYDGHGAQLSQSANATSTGVSTGVWESKTVELVAPTGAAGVRFIATLAPETIPTSNPLVLLREPQLLRRSNGELIVDGSIIAEKIAAGAITASKIDVDALNGKVITGSTIQTTETANRGIKFTSGAISAYDSTGTRTFYVSASTGDVRIAGDFQTAMEGSRVRIAPDANYTNQPGIRMYSGGTGARDAAMFIVPGGTDTFGWDAYDTAIVGSETTRNESGRAQLVLAHGGNWRIHQINGANDGRGIFKEGQVVRINGRLPAVNTSTARGQSGVLQVAARTMAQFTFWESTASYGAPPEFGTRVAFAQVEGTADATIRTQSTASSVAVSIVTIDSPRGAGSVSYRIFWHNV